MPSAIWFRIHKVSLAVPLKGSSLQTCSNKFWYFLQVHWALLISLTLLFFCQIIHSDITLMSLSMLTLSLRRPSSYRNQSIDLLCKSVDWFLHDNGLRHERVNDIECPFKYHSKKIYRVGTLISSDTLHKKWSILLRISSVSCRFGHIYWRNP